MGVKAIFILPLISSVEQNRPVDYAIDRLTVRLTSQSNLIGGHPHTGRAGRPLGVGS